MNNPKTNPAKGDTLENQLGERRQAWDPQPGQRSDQVAYRVMHFKHSEAEPHIYVCTLDEWRAWADSAKIIS